MDNRESEFLDELAEFLARPDVESFFSIHPNVTVAPAFTPPDAWSSWWDWAGEISTQGEKNVEPKWQQLWRCYTEDSSAGETFPHVPAPLRVFLRHARRLQLLREPGKEATVPGRHPLSVWDPADYDFPNTNLPGMSPKKTHEVLCMSKYASVLLAEMSSQGTAVKQVVDVGAGQVSCICSHDSLTYACRLASGPRIRSRSEPASDVLVSCRFFAD